MVYGLWTKTKLNKNIWVIVALALSTILVCFISVVFPLIALKCWPNITQCPHLVQGMDGGACDGDLLGLDYFLVDIHILSSLAGLGWQLEQDRH